jgi:hypothetical protein
MCGTLPAGCAAAKRRGPREQQNDGEPEPHKSSSNLLNADSSSARVSASRSLAVMPVTRSPIPGVEPAVEPLEHRRHVGGDARERGEAERGEHQRPVECRQRVALRPDVPQSLDHLIRPRQQRWGNPHAEGLRGLEVDDQFELRRLLDGQVGWFLALEDLVDLGAHTRSAL